jgi:hypothetical protein
MDLQQALGKALRAGFLSLAQARYSMGGDRVSALQVPSHMAATAFAHMSGKRHSAVAFYALLCQGTCIGPWFPVLMQMQASYSCW